MKRINVLFQSSDEYAFMAGVSITSLLNNASKEIFYDIYVIEHNYSESTKDKFEILSKSYPDLNYRINHINASDYDSLFEEYKVPSHRGSRVTYFKLLIQRIFENTDVDKIIHIDSDSLVTGDLHELIDFNFDGKPFAMNWTEIIHDRYHYLRTPVCIAGMIYFNLPVWKEMKCEERILRHISEIRSNYPGKDQNILNLEFENEYAQLPLKFNVYSFAMHFSKKNLLRFHNAPILIKSEIFEAIENPQIIHFARSFLYRPCEKDSVFFKKEYDLWWHYCKLSPWKEMLPFVESAPLGAKEKIFRFLYLHCSCAFCDVLYIYSRRLFGWILMLTHKPAKQSKIGYL